MRIPKLGEKFEGISGIWTVQKVTLPSEIRSPEYIASDASQDFFLVTLVGGNGLPDDDSMAVEFTDKEFEKFCRDEGIYYS
jgi:hypothetical protein